MLPRMRGKPFQEATLQRSKRENLGSNTDRQLFERGAVVVAASQVKLYKPVELFGVGEGVVSSQPYYLLEAPSARALEVARQYVLLAAAEAIHGARGAEFSHGVVARRAARPDDHACRTSHLRSPLTTT